MSKGKFTGWFSDVGFTVRVMIICEELEEWAVEWGCAPGSPFIEAVAEVRETAQLEMERWAEIGKASGYFRADEIGAGNTPHDPYIDPGQ